MRTLHPARALALLALAERIDMQDAPPSRGLVAEMGDRHELGRRR